MIYDPDIQKQLSYAILTGNSVTPAKLSFFSQLAGGWNQCVLKAFHSSTVRKECGVRHNIFDILKWCLVHFTGAMPAKSILFYFWNACKDICQNGTKKLQARDGRAIWRNKRNKGYGRGSSTRLRQTVWNVTHLLEFHGNEQNSQHVQDIHSNLFYPSDTVPPQLPIQIFYYQRWSLASNAHHFKKCKQIPQFQRSSMFSYSNAAPATKEASNVTCPGWDGVRWSTRNQDAEENR